MALAKLAKDNCRATGAERQEDAVKWLIEPLESRFAGMLCVWFAAIAVCDQIGMRDWLIVAVPLALILAYSVLAKGREIS